MVGVFAHTTERKKMKIKINTIIKGLIWETIGVAILFSYTWATTGNLSAACAIGIGYPAFRALLWYPYERAYKRIRRSRNKALNITITAEDKIGNKLNEIAAEIGIKCGISDATAKRNLQDVIDKSRKPILEKMRREALACRCGQEACISCAIKKLSEDVDAGLPSQMPELPHCTCNPMNESPCDGKCRGMEKWDLPSLCRCNPLNAKPFDLSLGHNRGCLGWSQKLVEGVVSECTCDAAIPSQIRCYACAAGTAAGAGKAFRDGVNKGLKLQREKKGPSPEPPDATATR